MSGILYLSVLHIRFHIARSLTIVLVMATLITIPILGQFLTDAAEARMIARAAATPLIYGASRSELDLVLVGAYFRGDIDAKISMEDYTQLLAMRMAALAPIYKAGSSAKYPIIGTDIEYLSLRNLSVAQGRKPVKIGEVLLGADVAQTLGLGVGDEIQSDVVQAFDLAGAYPVGMTVSGILAYSNTPDDIAILTDLKTSWIVAGIGHGHADLADVARSAILKKNDGVATANASLKTLIRISSDNLSSFHTHGSEKKNPLTAILVFPDDPKAAALIRGRVGDEQNDRQIVRPVVPISGLLADVFAVKKVLDRVMIALSVAALIALGLVLSLSMQMRSKEFEIAQRLGGRRGLSVLLASGELGILSLAALVLSTLLILVVRGIGTATIDTLVLGAV